MVTNISKISVVKTIKNLFPNMLCPIRVRDERSFCNSETQAAVSFLVACHKFHGREKCVLHVSYCKSEISGNSTHHFSCAFHWPNQVT